MSLVASHPAAGTPPRRPAASLRERARDTRAAARAQLPLPHLADAGAAGEAVQCMLQGMTMLPATPMLEDAITHAAEVHRG